MRNRGIKLGLVWVFAMITMHAKAQGFMEMFDTDKLGIITFGAGLKAGSIKNTQLDKYIAAYNKANQSKLSKEFNNFNLYTGFEIGARWTIMELRTGQIGGFKQKRQISPTAERVMDIKINYFDALATFPVAKGKLLFSLGLQTIQSVYSLSLKFNNGETSFGTESGLNGNYKGLGINGLIGAEGFLVKTDNAALGLSLEYTGNIAGAGGIWTDNNAAKNALNASGGITSLNIKTEFSGLVLGVNYHYIIGK